MSGAKTMAATCPACNGEMQFDPTQGKLKCEYCGSVYTPEEVDSFWKEKEAEAAVAGGGDWQADADEMKAYSCSACGAELMADQNTAVMVCPYCGNQTIAPAQFSGAIRPNTLIPFSFTKEQATQKYHEYYEKRLLLPKSFKTDNHVSEIQGVYVPFWLFNGTAYIKGTYDAYDTKETDSYRIEDHYEVKRRGKLTYERVPADASKRMEDALMDSIEPYKLDELKEFSISYLPGFLAERFDVNEEDDASRAEKRVENTIKSKVRATINHQTVNAEHEEVTFRRDKTEYSMLPVWMLTTRWNDKEYRFAMNGQTGKMIGDLPISVPKFLAVVIPVFAVAAVLLYLLMSSGWAFVIAAVVTLIVGLAMYGSMKPVHNASDANDYVGDRLMLSVKTEEFTRQVKKKKNNG